jgi:hypothetical protein
VEWSVGDYDPGSNNNVSQPMVVVDRLNGHAFALFELSAGNIGIVKWCDGDTDWSDVGFIDWDVNHDSPVDHVGRGTG